ncbi:MAG: DinB family protein [Bacteroidota bacterium]|nr:DinB family protein [Bacteroidota bacterium]
MIFKNLNTNEYPSVYEGYFANIQAEDHLLEVLEASMHYFIQFVQNIPMDKFDYAYQEGKWTIKQIIQHLIDSERIFAFRMLHICRKDASPLREFDHNLYVENSNAAQRHLKDLLMEFSLVRHSTLALLKSLTSEQLEYVGEVNNNVISVRALGFLIYAHQEHHKTIYEQRYLNS